LALHLSFGWRAGRHILENRRNTAMGGKPAPAPSRRAVPHPEPEKKAVAHV
jgi:hypothetical protein